jgi:alpha-1,3-glucosyltransferase
MHGDYEAQRHWMEITTQLPISQWYFHDLEWWGLDYPPLTAYHSYAMGKVGSYIDPTWFRLHTSRGLEDETLKVFMRATVIISEYLVYIPAAVIFVRRFSRLQGVQTWDASVALVAILLQPATMLIDHVHFQYNTVMLGLVLASASSIMAGRYMWSCVFFVLALGFKQMALYYAPAIFAYLLGVCIFPQLNFLRFLRIAVVTVVTFALLLLPILLGALYDHQRGIDTIPELNGHSPILPVFVAFAPYLDPHGWYFPPIHQIAQIVHRIFPFARGLFEDKVANFWCTLNILYKLRSHPIIQLQRLSLLATLVSILPPCFIIFVRPRKELLPLALASTAWGFFLFSFQVHEKSVLLPLMPMTLLLAAKDGLSPYTRSWVGFANMLGAWTLFPLLERVGLRVPYTVLALLWAYLLDLPPVSWGVYKGIQFDRGLLEQFTVLVHVGFYVMMVVWHVLEAFVEAPEALPDLWVVANVGVGAAGFGLCYIWCIASLVASSGLIGGSSSKNGSAKEEGKGKGKEVAQSREKKGAK